MNPRAFRDQQERCRTTTAQTTSAREQPGPAASDGDGLAVVDPFTTLTPSDGSPYHAELLRTHDTRLADASGEWGLTVRQH